MIKLYKTEASVLVASLSPLLALRSKWPCWKPHVARNCGNLQDLRMVSSQQQKEIEPCKEFSSVNNLSELRSRCFPGGASDETIALVTTLYSLVRHKNRTQLSHAKILTCKNCEITDMCCYKVLNSW